MFEHVKRLFWIWGECFKSMARINTFVPFILYALIQFGLLISLIQFVNPPFSGVYIPFIQKFFGDQALHYPNFYYIVTPIFNQVNLIASGFFGVIIIGMATQLFAQKFRNESGSVGTSMGTSFRKFGLLFLIWIIETAFMLLIILGVPYLLNNIFAPDYRLQQIFELVGLLFGILVASFFAYTTALIVLDNQSVGASLSKTFKLFSMNSITSYILIAVPTLIYFPISFLLRKAQFLMSKFSPEIITTLLAVGIVITLFTSYFQIGSITRLYLLTTERRR